MTAHGLDEGDRQALLSAYGHKVNEKMVRNCPPGTLVFNDVEHMNVRQIDINDSFGHEELMRESYWFRESIFITLCKGDPPNPFRASLGAGKNCLDAT